VSIALFAAASLMGGCNKSAGKDSSNKSTRPVAQNNSHSVIDAADAALVKAKLETPSSQAVFAIQSSRVRELGQGPVSSEYDERQQLDLCWYKAPMVKIPGSNAHALNFNQAKQISRSGTPNFTSQVAFEKAYQGVTKSALKTKENYILALKDIMGISGMAAGLTTGIHATAGTLALVTNALSGAAAVAAVGGLLAPGLMMAGVFGSVHLSILATDGPASSDAVKAKYRAQAEQFDAAFVSVDKAKNGVIEFPQFSEFDFEMHESFVIKTLASLPKEAMSPSACPTLAR
jgi:hypothetical protein